jgi:hypothetical protein
VPSTPPPRRPGLLRKAATSLRRWLGGNATPYYPGDYTGPLDPVYDPHADGRPDPGEIVWTWVPFEEDFRQGKDRPVLLVGRDGRWLLGLQLTSQDHDGRPAHDNGPHWVDIGAGDWDHQRRPSEVRVDRVIRVDPAAVRREGAVLARQRFATVARAVADVHR